MTYRIESRGNCTLVFGAAPISKISEICTRSAENLVMDSQVARIMNASFAIGPAQELRTLAAEHKRSAIARQRQQYPGLAQDAVLWLAVGERGVSSNTIFHCLTGIDVMDGALWCAPRDLADWRRCQLLLEQVNMLTLKFERMQEESSDWLRLVTRWHDIGAALDAECPNWRAPDQSLNAPRARALFEQALAVPTMRRSAHQQFVHA